MTHEYLRLNNTIRGFHLTVPQINREGGSVQVSESSNADVPSLWFLAADEQGNHVQIELDATSAYHFAEQIMNLLRCHYQGDVRPDDRITAFLEAPPGKD